MSETSKSIGSWTDGVFGSVTNYQTGAARANEEMAELITAVSRFDLPQAALEIADVVICLHRLANDLGYDLQELVDRKMVINRNRKWRPDGTGHGKHIKEESDDGLSMVARGC
jgi:NTP pyrophosphatase (non-canonical NTP hydrolase)